MLSFQKTLLVVGALALVPAPSWASSIPAAAPQSSTGALVAYHADHVFNGWNDGQHEAWLLVQDGKIVGHVGREIDLPPLCEVVDFGDAFIMPGLVAADATLTGTGRQGDHSLGAHRRALDNFNPYRDTTSFLSRGVTTVYLSPDRYRLVGGRGAVVKTAGQNRILNSASDLRIELSHLAWNAPDYFRPPLPPTDANPDLIAIAQAPQSRAGAMMALRQSHERSQGDALAFDVHDAAFSQWLASNETLRVAVDSADDIRAAIALSREWARPLLVVGSHGLGEMAAELAAVGAKAIFRAPLFANLPEDTQWQAPDADTLSKLADAQLPFAVAVSAEGSWLWLLEAASAAVSYGAPQALALSSLTTIAAQTLGVDSQVGSLLPGMDADFIVLDGAPLSSTTSVRQTWVDGRRVWNRADMVDTSADSQQASQTAPAVVVRAGTLWSGKGDPLTGGVEVLLMGGKVVSAGRSVPHPPGARILEAGADAHLTPGFIDAAAHLTTERKISPEVLLNRVAAGRYWDESWASVARAGVTTVLTGTPQLSANGARYDFVKTAGVLPQDSGMTDRHVVYFSADFSDPMSGLDNLRKSLTRGKEYADKWVKWREERAKWESEHAAESAEKRIKAESTLREQLSSTWLRSNATQEEEAADEVGKGDDSEAAEEAEEEEVVVDRINGLWEAVIEDERLPDSITIHLLIHHEGKDVTASITSPDEPSGESFDLEGGVWEGDIITFEVPTEMGNVILTATLDAPDHAAVHAELAGLGAIDFEMNRIEIEEEGAKKDDKKKKVKADEGPAEPDKKWALEGSRALFERRAVAVIQADRADEVRGALALFTEFEIPVHVQLYGSALTQASGLSPIGEDAGVTVSSVVLAPPFVKSYRARNYVPAAKLQERGVNVAFASFREFGGRFLPNALSMAARYGLGTQEALESLTSGAAEMFGVADRIGSLEPGLDADLVVHSGPPLELGTRVLHVFVNGREVKQ
ncbi:MAG: amidohydrolase family protein [Planctomycetes bacterium]|jgi:imidazolonepropionase-like amidohydrolase|nr:amidohydrolase family protein [Planctomycetota bacterium]MBT4560019.1 amidohydrolase family protein [Planctomycetota bacterium]MBT7318593.1 amidohydrolase family protein [Planctomycetota bacterium]